MPQPIWLEPWHRLSRAVPTFEAVAHHAAGPEWEEITRTVQVMPVKGSPNRWSVALFSGTKRVRDWLLPDVVEATDAQKAAERLILTWGIRDEDVNPEVGQERKMSLEQTGGFAWARLKKTVVAMFRNPQTRADGVTVINRLYPGRGSELGQAMIVIEKAAGNDLGSLMKIVDLRAEVLAGDESKRAELTKLQMVNEARKEAEAAEAAFRAERVAEWRKKLGLQPEGGAFQAEVTRLAMAPERPVEQSPYHLLTGAGGLEEGESEGDYRTPEEKKRDREKFAKYKKEWLDTPKGKEWQVLQNIVNGQIHWYRIDVKHISDLGNKPLTLTVEKFSGTTDYYPTGQGGKVLKLDRNGAFALAKKVADQFKATRGTDVAVEWTAATD